MTRGEFNYGDDDMHVFIFFCFYEADTHIQKNNGIPCICGDEC